MEPATDELESFRQEVRSWLEENCPPSMRTPPQGDDEVTWGGRKAKFKNPEAKLWLERMGARGWTAPTWPAEYGGGGLSREQARILAEELRRIQARPPLMSFGISMLGPVLLEFANEEQKKEHIPKILRGEIRWCQGYSEPGAGSDLASLQMRAVPDGDDYVINGQKVWTSYADQSDWIFCLVRTDTSGDKRDGISFILFDMDDPGIRVSPIKLISGNSPFCEVFCQDVRVPQKSVVGKVNGGWTIAKRLLQHERSMISQMGNPGARVRQSLPDLARKYLGDAGGRVSDPILRDQIAQIEMDALCFGLTFRRSAEATKAGQGPGHAASMFKYYGTELNKRRFEAMMSVVGTQALGWEGEGFDEGELDLTRQWLRSKGNSIEGGTSEIQLNVIAKRVLGLPD